MSYQPSRHTVELEPADNVAITASLSEAKLAHDLTHIKVPGITPISQGMPRREFLILERKIQEGQMVGPQGGPLFTLAGSLDVVELHTQVAEGDINRVHKDLKAVFTVKDFHDDDTEFQGTVKEIRPLASTIKGAGLDASAVIPNQ